MKLIVGFRRRRAPMFTGPVYEIFPYIRLCYKGDMLLETGVYTRALILSWGWIKWNWSCTIQEQPY